MNNVKTAVAAIVMGLVCSNVVSAQAPKVRVTLREIEGYGANESFAQNAAQLLEDVLNSEEFRKEVLKRRFRSTLGLSNQELYERLMTAHEVEGPGGQDGVVDLRARTLRIDSDESRWKNACAKKTIGVDGAGTGITAICPQKLREWAADGRTEYLAAHYAHEYAHILGFHHKGGSKSKSFVYRLGDIVESLAEDRRKAQARAQGGTP